MKTKIFYIIIFLSISFFISAQTDFMEIKRTAIQL